MADPFAPAYVLARAVRRGEVSPVELVRDALDRIAALNPSLNAFAALRPEAALAAGMGPLVTGSDGGGPVRIPACYVGAFGLKPSFGRVPTGAREPGNMLPWVDTVCYGPITRTVRDAALFLDVVAGVDPSDPDSLPAPG